MRLKVICKPSPPPEKGSCFSGPTNCVEVVNAETGERINDVVSVHFHSEWEAMPTLIIEVIDFDVEIEADGVIIKGNPEAD